MSCLYSNLEGGTEQGRDLLYDSLGYTQTTLMFGGAPVEDEALLIFNKHCLEMLLI